MKQGRATRAVSSATLALALLSGNAGVNAEPTTAQPSLQLAAATGDLSAATTALVHRDLDLFAPSTEAAPNDPATEQPARPSPDMLWLLGAGMLGVATIARRRSH